MDNNQTTPAPAPVPKIEESELKLPQENLSTLPKPEPAKGPISPLLIILLMIALALLGAVIVWGEEILDLVMPLPADAPTSETVKLQEATTTTERTLTPEEDMAKIEAEASSTESEMAEMDKELNSIEAELNAEAQ